MKVKDLIFKLQQLDPEAEAVIPVYLTQPTVGARPVVKIEHVGRGIDWDNNRVMLTGESNLISLTGSQFEYFYEEFLKASMIRSDAFKKGISDVKVIENGMNPLFKTGNKDAK
jgi:hypothetical protein